MIFSDPVYFVFVSSVSPAEFHGLSELDASTIEHGLMRKFAIREFKRGRAAKEEICDANSELLRVAENLGEPSSYPCPICTTEALVNLTFAFAQKLPRSGLCVSSKREVTTLREVHEDIAFYLVEVCRHCRWNYLLKKIGPSHGL